MTCRVILVHIFLFVAFFYALSGWIVAFIYTVLISAIIKALQLTYLALLLALFEFSRFSVLYLNMSTGFTTSHHFYITFSLAFLIFRIAFRNTLIILILAVS